jgi:AcrR family transcriptional regulator
MHETVDTATALIDAARALFAEGGYRGASIRAITARAGANLGAVTYHFGSKERLYEAVAASMVEPLAAHVANLVTRPGSSTERTEALVTSVFDYLQEHPDLPRFMVQLLGSARPIPQAVQTALRRNHRAITELLAEGQADGSVRAEEPGLLALNIIAIPIWLTLVRRLLQQALGLDQDDREIRRAMIETAVRFIRAGLAPPSEGDA